MIDADVIVGLEVHCQLDTKSKLFCGCSTDYRNDGPNTHVCPVCLGLPGTMPMLNKRVIEYAMKVQKRSTARSRRNPNLPGRTTSTPTSTRLTRSPSTTSPLP